MKQSKSILTRSFALVMALVLLVSSANLGAVLSVSAAEGDKTITVAQLVANNYELTDAEEALLNSGNLTCDSISYNVPADESLVEVNTEKKQITAKLFENWTPVVAKIVVGDEVKEEVELHDCTGTYAYAGNAFSVKVDYVLEQPVMLGTQEALLNAGFEIKADLDEMKAVYEGTDANLGTIMLAMPTLIDLANGVDFDMIIMVKHLQFEEAAANAVFDLEKQGEEFDLQKWNAQYAAAANKVEFLHANGPAFSAAAAAMRANLEAIANEPLLNNAILDMYIEHEGGETLTKWLTFKSILNSTLTALENVSDWNVAGIIVPAGADYAELESQIAALGDATAVTLKDTLTVDNATIQKNLSMVDVYVTVKLNTVQLNEIVETAVSETVKITVAEGTVAADVYPAIHEVLDATVATWSEVYEAEHYVPVSSDMPEVLTEDVEYVVTYEPKNYTVTYGVGFENVAAEVYPYGYVLTLPVHDNASFAYDYAVNGIGFPQGYEYTVRGDAEVVREEGKAYSYYDLFQVIAGTSELDAELVALLNSGALKGNETLKLRAPDASEADELLKLEMGTLTAVATYESDYRALNWAPYSYDGKLFNGNVATGLTSKSSEVIYRLTLSNQADYAAQLGATLAKLPVEAATQIGALERLMGHYGNICQLNKTKLGALNGVIDVTDLNDDPAKNAALKKEFKTIVSSIINNNLDGAVLKLETILTKYDNEQTGGIDYYYRNAEYVLSEIKALSKYLNGMTDNEEKQEALRILTVAAGFPEYEEKISELGRVLEEVTRDLSLPNEIIDLESENLYKVTEILQTYHAVTTLNVVTPYIDAPAMTALDSSVVNLTAVVTVGGQTKSFAAGPYDFGTEVKGDIDMLAMHVEAFAKEVLGEKYNYYSNNLSDLTDLYGEKLIERKIVRITYKPVNYKVHVGGTTVLVNADKLSVTLPGNTKTGYSYKYDVFGTEYKVGANAQTIVLKLADLDKFVDGEYSIVRSEFNQALDDLMNNLNKPTEPKPTEPADPDAPTEPVDPDAPVEPTEPEAPVIPEPESELFIEMREIDGELVPHMVMRVVPNATAMDLVTKLTSMTISNLVLNGEQLMGLDENNTLKISMQTLLNAMLNDPEFGSETIINIGQNNGGVLFTADFVGNNEDGSAKAASEDEAKYEIVGKFVVELAETPAEMTTAANGLAAIRNYMTFKANNGVLDFNLNLPDKVYELYLTALMSNGYLDSDALYINNEIAYQFLRDYFDIILYSDATAQSFQNSLDMLDDVTGAMPETNLAAYSAYYNGVKSALINGNVVIEPHGEKPLTIDMVGAGQTGINGLLSLIGMSAEDFAMELGMVKEYQDGAAPLYLSMTATLENTHAQSEAAILDVVALAKGGVNKDVKRMSTGLDFTSDLNARLAETEGVSFVVLMSDVEGDLVINNGAIIDLNGHFINGDLKANANVIILDSTLATTECGGVKGDVSGKATIIAGNYTDNVSAFLDDGYYQDENGAVVNCLFIAEKDGDKLTYVINSDYMYCEDLAGFVPSVRAVAADIALDLVSNKYMRAALTVDGTELYNVDFDNLIALLDSDDKVHDLVDKVLGCFNARGIAAYTKSIAKDLLDLKGLAYALENDGVIGQHEITVRPWWIDLQYVAETDHVDFGIVANPNVSETTVLGMKIVGSNIEALIGLAHELHDVISVDVDLDVKKPVIDRDTNKLSLAGDYATTVLFDFGRSDRYEKLDYLTVLTVIMANGNPGANADAMVAGLNNSGMDGIDLETMKGGFDQMTVKDLFDALKKLNKTDDFKQLAANVGVELYDDEQTDKLENIYHLFITATGKILDKLHVEGLNSKLGNIDKDNDGIYELVASVDGHVDASARGYTVDLNVENVTLTVKFDIFGCLWGDADHNFVIDLTDAILMLKHEGEVPMGEDQIFCEKRTDVNADDWIDLSDAILVLKHEAGIVGKFPAER